MLNPSFERQAGIPIAAGLHMREIAPLHEEHWSQLYGRIGLTDKPMRFENPAAERRVAILFIDERKQTEAELERMQSMLAEGQRIVHLGTFEYVADNQTTVWSEEEYRIYGLDPAGPSPTYNVMLANNIHPDDSALLHETFTRAMQSGSIYELEHRIVRPDGTVRWVYDRAHPYFDESGGLVRYVGATLDVTERKQAEQALRDSEETLRLAQDAAAIGTFEWNIRTGVNTWTPRLELLYGLPAGSFGRTQAAWENLVHPEDRAEAVARVQQTLETGEPGEAEFRVIWPDGSVKWLYARWQVIKDASGTPLRLRGVNIDITHRKQTEEGIRHAQRLESIGRLAGGLAHDYNNLMSIILLHTDSALEELTSGEAAVNSVAAIRDAAEKAVALGQQLMAFSSKQVMPPEVLDLNSVMADTKKLVERLIGEDVTVTFNPGSGLGLVRAGRGQLIQIIMNLAVNSRDAMPQGGAFTIETANVEFDASNARLNPGALPGPYVMLMVRDTGLGMDKSTQARIFEPFFTTKPIGRGTGLGLSFVYGIVRQSGGFITVSSEPGHGTEFRIYLPAVLEMHKSILASEHEPALGGSETILLVEDEPALRQKICEVMENAGYRVLVAGDGDEGLRLAMAGGQIHLLLTDVVMPNMSGPQMAEHLRTIRPDTKILYMSGYADLGAGSEAPRPQTNFIQKPFTQEALLRRVRQVLDDNTTGKSPASK